MQNYKKNSGNIYATWHKLISHVLRYIHKKFENHNQRRINDATKKI